MTHDRAWRGIAELDNNFVIICRLQSTREIEMPDQTKTFGELVAEEQLSDPSFRAEWQRLAPAREFAATLLRHRAEKKLNQRELATQLGVSQPRVVKLESGEHNPGIDTIINAVRQLGIEFALDVAPADRRPALVTARARRAGAIEHDDVAVMVASSAGT
jgi:DNA-binding XRE family transcriptional regulator